MSVPIRGFPYDSQKDAQGNEDRVVTSEDDARRMRRLFSGGVLLWVGNELQVTETVPPTRGVRVNFGAGLADGRFGEAEAALTFTLDVADPNLPRRDLIALQRHLDPAVRASRIVRHTGTPATVPAAPTPQQDATVWEEGLAWVDVAAGATSITNANITDRRQAARAPDALRLQGRVPGAAAGNLPILDGAGRVPLANVPPGLIMRQYRHPLYGFNGEGVAEVFSNGWVRLGNRQFLNGFTGELPAISPGCVRRHYYQGANIAFNGAGALIWGMEGGPPGSGIVRAAISLPFTGSTGSTSQLKGFRTALYVGAPWTDAAIAMYWSVVEAGTHINQIYWLEIVVEDVTA